MPKPESLKSNLKSEVVKQAPHSETQRLQVTGCTAEKYCLLHVVVQGSGSFRDQLNVFVICTTYSGGATGRQSCPFF